MTLAWAIIIVAVLFLLDRHHLLKKTLVAANHSRNRGPSTGRWICRNARLSKVEG